MSVARNTDYWISLRETADKNSAEDKGLTRYLGDSIDCPSLKFNRQMGDVDTDKDKDYKYFRVDIKVPSISLGGYTIELKAYTANGDIDGEKIAWRRGHFPSSHFVCFSPTQQTLDKLPSNYFVVAYLYDGSGLVALSNPIWILDPKDFTAVLTIDATGSMGFWENRVEERLEKAKFGAQLFIDLVSLGSDIGVVSFKENSTVEYVLIIFEEENIWN